MLSRNHTSMCHGKPHESSSDEDSDETAYHSTCARIKQVIQSMNKLEARHANSNRFADLDPEEGAEDKEEEETGDVDKVHEEKKEGKQEDDGRWTTVRKKVNGLLVNQHQYSEEQCKIFSKMYNAYFEFLTGKDLKFVITPSSQPYVSVFDACMERDQVLMTLFNERPIIVDPMGGSGSDSAAMLFNLYPKFMWVCEWVYTANREQQKIEYSILKQNMNHLQELFDVLNEEKDPNAPKVRCINMDCKDFLLSMDMRAIVHILYLDPNWAKPNSKYERTPAEMVEYLRTSVIEPLNERKIVPKCIVYKTRWASEVLWEFMKMLSPDYHPMYSIEATPFREHVDETSFEEKNEVHGRFHWVIILHNELHTIHWKRSKAFMDIYRNGTDVVVAKKDQIEPFIPLYAHKFPRPEETENDEGGETMIIKPPHKKAPRPQKAKHNHGARAHPQ